VSGDIAMRIQGKYPVRRKEEGKFVLDGSKSSNGWQAFIPAEQNVADKNPERGFVSSANQYPVDETYPYYVTATSYEAYRNRRINNVLRALPSVTVKDMMNLQNDNYSIKAEESLPMLMSHLDTTSFTDTEKEAYRNLKAWDYSYHINSEGASYFEAWWTNLMPLVWDEIRRDDYALSYPTAWNTINLIKTKPELSFFDVLETPEKETAPDVVRMAFKKGVEEMEQWKNPAEGTLRAPRWADYKDTYVEHLARLEPLSEHVEHGGNGNAVNASSRRAGPSWRMIVSLEKDGVNAWATYPGGQSGNPGSVHYLSMLDHWTKGKYFKFQFMQEPVASDKTNMTITTLNPKRK
jgi:penicillin G amidase